MLLASLANSGALTDVLVDLPADAVPPPLPVLAAVPVDEEVVEANGSEENGSCPLNGSVGQRERGGGGGGGGGYY